MNTLSEIIQRSRWNLAVLLLLSGAGVAAVMITSNSLKSARLENQQAKLHLKDAGEMLKHVRDEQQDHLRRLEIYREIAARGYVGEERRHEWVERIRSIKEQRKLLDIRYELSRPQVIMDKPGNEIVISNMKLQMQLLHEEDLLNFLDDLRHSVPAYLRLRSCDVERLVASESAGPTIAQLKAECSIDWITWRTKIEVGAEKAGQT